jgi:cellulose synthase/poly-beta-1,6-N-acetylglucosamine synthase-like glycosyltransferase
MGASSVDVSVVIPAFRREHQVTEAIGNALVQTNVSLEVLVFDDGLNADAVASFADSRVRYFKCPESHAGQPAAVSNVAAGLSRGRHLHFLDADDQLEGDSLLALSRALDGAPQAGMAFGAIIPFGGDPVEFKRQQIFFRNAAGVARCLRSRLQLVANLLYLPPILVNSACMVRRECFLAAGGYDSSMSAGEDIDLWMRIARLHDFIYLDRPIVHHCSGAARRSEISTEHEARLKSASRHSRRKYRQQFGGGELLLLSAWAKTTLRI